MLNRGAGTPFVLTPSLVVPVERTVAVFSQFDRTKSDWVHCSVYQSPIEKAGCLNLPSCRLVFYKSCYRRPYVNIMVFKIALGRDRGKRNGLYVCWAVRINSLLWTANNSRTLNRLRVQCRLDTVEALILHNITADIVELKVIVNFATTCNPWCGKLC